jgi:hypothetical protein
MKMKSNLRNIGSQYLHISEVVAKITFHFN